MSEESKLKDGGVASTNIYNVEAAEILANEALLLPLSEAVPIYEQLLSTFPTSARFWKQYVEAYMAVGNDEATKQIFSRCLLNCLQISLWRCYIRFIRKVNDKKGTEGLEEIRKSFEFMLSYVGSDVSAGPLWMEYLTFLKSMPVTAAQESQRMTSLRKIYQKAIVTPTHQIEQLWKDYENFENSINRALAKGLLSEYQPKYNSARAVYRERKKFIDEIDWNMLAVPPNGSLKEEQQCIAWKRLLAFEKANPQRIDTASSNRRIIFTYEQCMMFMFHYPDIWYDYATWHSRNTTLDSAVKVFQRALKALPDSAPLKYAYAELEESRGAIQPAKKIYESLVDNNSSVTSLAHIQFIKFLRRTEGVEAARRYFLDAQKLSNCTYHVFVYYAMMTFCLDKDVKVAHNVFEAGLKKFMNEPEYILEYADFLCRLNDDKNVRVLFERALSLLPPENSEEVWKSFAKFEQTYGDLTSILKVERRRKEALSRPYEEDSSALESTLNDVVSRYNFMDLWPCSSKELDHLARQEWLAKTVDKKADKSALLNWSNSLDKISMGQVNKVHSQSSKVVYPDTSRMVIYDPRKINEEMLTISNSIGSANYKALDDLETVAPALVAFSTNLPSVEGPFPDVETVLSILMQCTIPAGASGITVSGQQVVAGSGLSTSDLSGSSKTWLHPNGSSRRFPREGPSLLRKDIGQDDDETTTQSRPLPRDMFRLRQIQKSRGSTTSQTGSAASAGTGSAFSGEQSISTD